MIPRIPDVFEQRPGHCQGGEVPPRFGEMPIVLVPGPVATERSPLFSPGPSHPPKPTIYTIKTSDCLIKGSGYTINSNLRLTPTHLSKRIEHPIPIYTLNEHGIFQRVLKPLK